MGLNTIYVENNYCMKIIKRLLIITLITKYAGLFSWRIVMFNDTSLPIDCSYWYMYYQTSLNIN